jgi:Tfp pilus assembly protein PilF
MIPRILVVPPAGSGDLTDHKNLRAGLSILSGARAYLSSAVYLSRKGHHNTARRRYRQAVALARMDP